MCVLSLSFFLSFKFADNNNNNNKKARLRNLPLWQDIRSWQFIFAVRVHNSLRSIYKCSVVERWSTLDAKSKLDFEDSEWGHIQTHIVTLTSKMSSLGLSPVLIGRFARGVCMNMRVPPEREASLMKLIKCIPEDTEVKPLQPEPPTPALTEAKFVVLWVESKILQPVPKAAMIAVKQAVERTISPVVFCGACLRLFFSQSHTQTHPSQASNRCQTFGSGCKSIPSTLLTNCAS